LTWHCDRWVGIYGGGGTYECDVELLDDVIVTVCLSVCVSVCFSVTLSVCPTENRRLS